MREQHTTLARFSSRNDADEKIHMNFKSHGHTSIDFCVTALFILITTYSMAYQTHVSTYPQMLRQK